MSLACNQSRRKISTGQVAHISAIPLYLDGRVLPTSGLPPGKEYRQELFKRLRGVDVLWKELIVELAIIVSLSFRARLDVV